jgi:uridine phosphorylase
MRILFRCRAYATIVLDVLYAKARTEFHQSGRPQIMNTSPSLFRQDMYPHPILEFDPAREAFVEPSRLCKPRDVPEHCVICFFQDVIEKVVAEQQAKVVVDSRWEDGSHPIYEIAYHDRRLAFFHPCVGGAMAAGLLEEAIAYGCRKFIVCGGCGVLEKDIAVGHLIVVSSAVRDEGTSYHYLPPGREVQADRSGVAALEATLRQRDVPYLIGKTWTTDAPYRETPAKIAARKSEGCLTVEMEAASLIAVAQFREVVLGQVLYSGDDLSGGEWDNRAWQSRREIRRNLFWLAAEACLEL